MASSQLILHRGARPVTLEELATVPAPPPEGRWRPVPHIVALNSVKETLAEFGYDIAKEQHGLSRNDARWFGTLDLTTPLVEGVALAVGVRSSTDKSFPLGLTAGNRVACCDNLLLTGDITVKHKHTTNSQARFRESIAQAIGKLAGYREVEAARIERMKSQEIAPLTADSYLLRFFERGVIPARHLSRVIQEWRSPSFPEFQDRTFWNLTNAVTTALRDTQQGDPAKYTLRTMRLYSMLSQDPLLN